MRKQIARLTGALGCVLLTACAAAPGQFAAHSFAPGADEDAATRVTNGTVIDGEELRRGGGSLLRAIDRKVYSMEVRETAGCPAITMRGQKTVVTSSNPKVYLDGQPAMDTCILDQVRVHDVARVEVYPMGVTSRPGYLAHPHGLILVFTRTAE